MRFRLDQMRMRAATAPAARGSGWLRVSAEGAVVRHRWAPGVRGLAPAGAIGDPHRIVVAPCAPEAAPGIEEIAVEARRRLAGLAPEVRQQLEASLRDDMVTEYDARFLVEYLESLDVPLSAGFEACLSAWYQDEVRHFSSFRCIVETCLGDAAPELEARRPDFSGVRHLFQGEFEILCLLAYDELATLRGYRGNLPLYDLLGDALGAFVRRVIGDEAGHYAGFRALLIEKHGDRLHEVEDVVRSIRATEGTPYKATFVLDHDDPVYGDHIFDEAARVLVTQMRRERDRLAASAG